MLLQAINPQGEIPKLKPRVLPDNFAQRAVNCRMDDGSCRPLHAPMDITAAPAGTGSIYRQGETWRFWPGEVTAVPGPVRTERLYVAGDGAPKMIVGATTYNLALPGPTEPPTATPLQAVSSATAERILYAYTWVTIFDEESKPSPMRGLDWSAGVTVRLAGFQPPPANRAVNRLRFYRSQTGLSGNTELFYVGEVNVAAVQWDHDVNLAPIVDPISVAHFETPDPGLRGFTVMPNGMVAGFVGRTLAFCEPYMPHAWPIRYQLQLDFDIVGLAAFGSMLAIMTKGQPYTAQGTHPDTMTLTKIEVTLPCLSARGIVDLGYAAAYPSTEGLVLISADGARLVTEPLIGREQWQALDPASMVAGRHADGYVFSFTGSLDGRPERTGILALTGARPFITWADVSMRAVFNDLAESRLFYLEGEDVRSFDDPASGWLMTQTWRSKRFTFPFATNFGALRVRGDSENDPDMIVIAAGGTDPTGQAEPITSAMPVGSIFPDYAGNPDNYATTAPGAAISDVFLEISIQGGPWIMAPGYQPLGDLIVRLIANGRERAISSGINQIHRLKGGYLAEEWEIEISGKAAWISVAIAATPTELMSESA